MYLEVNTQIVRDVAQEISKENTGIDQDFDTVKKAMEKLDNTWDGNAAEKSYDAFNNIVNVFVENRYNAIDNMVSFLTTSVGETYENLEGELNTAASYFK